jgi:hypothetical protein
MHAVRRVPTGANSIRVGFGAAFFATARCTGPSASNILTTDPGGAPLAFAHAAWQASLYITSMIVDALSSRPASALASLSQPCSLWFLPAQDAPEHVVSARG